jgi:hypothetical protein
VKIFSKIFYFTLIPLVILLFVAIFTRLFAYGITEPRYFVLALAIWISFLAGYFIISKKDKIIVIPISLAFIILFSLSMPYFNAFSVAKRSQKSELMHFIVQEKLLKNEKIDFSKKISNKSANQAADIIAFLLMRKEDAFVKNLMAKNEYNSIIKENDFKWKYSLESNINQLFTNKTGNSNNDNTWTLTPTIQYHNVSGYNYFVVSTNIKPEGVKLDTETLYLNALSSVNNNIILSLSSGEQLDFKPLIEQKINSIISKNVPVSEISMESDLGKYHIKLVFDNIPYLKKGNKIETTYLGDFYILIKLK